MTGLITEYRETLRMVRRAHRRSSDEVDRSIMAGMIRDLEWSIAYMEHGHPPHEQAYPRTLPRAPHQLEQAVAQSIWRERHELEERGIEGERAKRLAVWLHLWVLSPQERRAVELVLAQGFSEREAAQLMGVSRRTVRTYLGRARDKWAAGDAGNGRVAHP